MGNFDHLVAVQLMQILILTPVPSGSTRGNNITAERWQRMLQSQGHKVDVKRVALDPLPEDLQFVIALHGVHNSQAIENLRRQRPNLKIAICMSGTDLYRLSVEANESDVQRIHKSWEVADKIILLEPNAQKLVSKQHQQKCVVVIQSSEPIALPRTLSSDNFVVSVLGHLRPVKDPFRTASASRLLPASSQAKVIHVGAALTSTMEQQATLESTTNPRYEWLGAVSHSQALTIMVNSHLTVLSSLHEGGPSVISEAVVNRVPILTSRIRSCVGLLGEDYQGYFEVGNSQQLADLIWRAESDAEFLPELERSLDQRASRFTQESELAALKTLLEA